MDKDSWKIKNEKRDCSILKPASSSSNSSPPHLLQKSSQEVPIQRPDSTEIQRPNFIFESSCIQNLEQKYTQAVRSGNRCSSCRKRVGLTGFRCRCGDLFCGRHRYSDAHDCSFDYKAAGREEISKANPVIRAAKIIKI